MTIKRYIILEGGLCIYINRRGNFLTPSPQPHSVRKVLFLAEGDRFRGKVKDNARETQGTEKDGSVGVCGT